MKITTAFYADPGSSLAYKTGSWGTQHPRFLWDKCTGCGLCELYCPEGIIYPKEKKKYTFVPEYCKGCGICAAECPVEDIEMESEVEYA
ncbi:MAG: 4Fe-4S binding protein [Anaerolineae bacterium]